MKAGHREAILYLFFGVCTTLINTIIYVCLYEFKIIGNIGSNIIAWLAAVVFAFFTNKIYVFQSTGVSPRRFFYEIVSFFSCRIATGLLDIIIMFIGVDILAIEGIIMKIFSNIIVIVLNYIASKIFIFQKKKDI